ncbi:MAG TPA: lysoplasmalogenase [Kofleriaceae bacterium]|nr:lysoplasmalogenase [Kofleriaceae bacterium]
MIAFTCLCAIACGVLVAAELLRREAWRRIAKPIASLGFVMVSTLAIPRALPLLGALALWIWIAQLLGCAGDLALLVSGSYRGREPEQQRAWFGYGLVAFLLGHMAYVIGFSTVVPPTRWLTAGSWFALAPIVVTALVVRWLWPHLGSLRPAVASYIAVITVMVIAAIAVWRAAPAPLVNRELLAGGAMLFFASDLAVARDTFVTASWTNRAWGLPAYYAGQLMIAWSVV